MKRVVALAAAVAAFGFQTAVAQPSFYAGAGLGVTKVEDFCEDTDTCDDGDYSAKIFGGARFNENFAFEVGYHRLGEISASAVLLGQSLSYEIDASAVTGHGLLIAPINDKAELFVKAGLAFWTLDYDIDINGNGLSDNETGTDFVVGAGANILANDRLSVRFDLDYMPKLGDDDTTGEADVINVSAAVQYRF